MGGVEQETEEVSDTLQAIWEQEEPKSCNNIPRNSGRIKVPLWCKKQIGCLELFEWNGCSV